MNPKLIVPRGAWLLVSLLTILVLQASADDRVIVLDFRHTPPAGLLPLEVIPEKPDRGVVDPAEQLAEDLREQTEHALSSDAGARVFLVILDDKPEAATADYCNELLRRWLDRKSGLGALVLVLSSVGETHVVLAGRDLDEMDVRQLTDVGEAALQIPDAPASHAAAAAGTAIALMPALGALAEIHSTPVVEGEGIDPTTAPAAAAAARAAAAEVSHPPTRPVSEQRADVETTSYWQLLLKRLDWDKIRLVSLISGGVILLLVALILVPRLMRNRRLYFPEHQPRRRFDGPFSGGCNAMIHYQRK